MTIPANAAPVIDHPALPALPPVPTPLPPATWDQQQADAQQSAQATLEARTAAVQTILDNQVTP